jgi:uracil-xanthine permease
MIFLLITRNKVPSYLGSSFAFIAPVIAAASGGNFGVATFGILCTGVLLALVGLLVMKVGTGWVNVLMPPVVTGVIVALIGFNLAPEALKNFIVSPVTACVTFGAIVLFQALSKGMVGRLSILLGVLVGYVCAIIRNEVDFATIGAAQWIGLPDLMLPIPEWSILPMFLPVVLVLIAENIGHVKSVATMTGKNLDGFIGHALFADGLGTTLSGLGGGSGTTTYAENIGVMAATRVYSTAAYWIAGLGALILSLCPKFGAAVASVPAGVLGGVCILLYGMIGMLGVRIWVENRVDFSKPINIITTAVPMVLAIANLSISFGASVETNVGIANLIFTSHGVVNAATGELLSAPPDAITLGAIAVSSVVALALYHLVRILQRLRGIDTELETEKET